MRSIARSPDDRPQSMESFMDQLQACYGRVIYRSRMRDLPAATPAPEPAPSPGLHEADTGPVQRPEVDRTSPSPSVGAPPATLADQLELMISERPTLILGHPAVVSRGEGESSAMEPAERPAAGASARRGFASSFRRLLTRLRPR
jgi:hypothetical protein